MTIFDTKELYWEITKDDHYFLTSLISYKIDLEFSCLEYNN